MPNSKVLLVFKLLVLKFRKYHKISYGYYPVLADLGFLSLDLSLVIFIKIGLLKPSAICLFYLIFVSIL